MKVNLFRRGKVDSLFVVVDGNYICHRCAYRCWYKYRNHEYQSGLLGRYYWLLFILLVRKWRILVKWLYLEINCAWYIRFFIGICECVFFVFNWLFFILKRIKRFYWVIFIRVIIIIITIVYLLYKILLTILLYKRETTGSFG